MSPSTWVDSSDAGSYGFGYDACSSVPVMMPSGEVIPMVPAANWGTMSSEEATVQSAEFQQGYQACYMWMTGMQQGVPVYPMATTAATEDTSVDGTDTESEVKSTATKPRDAEKLSLEMLLPPPADPPVGGTPPIAASLESMLFDTSSPSRDTCAQPKGLPSGTTGSMKEQLRALRMVDPAAVFIVRGIKPLGTPVVQQLQTYFSQFGEVTNVYAPHSRVKLNKLPTYQRAPVSRWRVANTGFVVMKDADAVAHVLEQGQTHHICGVLVSVHEFHRHNSVDVDGDGDDVAAEESTSASSNQDVASNHDGGSNHDSGSNHDGGSNHETSSNQDTGSNNETGSNHDVCSPYDGFEGGVNFATEDVDLSYFHSAAFAYDGEAFMADEATNLCRFFYTLSAEELWNAMPEHYDD